MRVWAPPGYKSLAFSAESTSKKLARLFGRKRAGAKAPSGAELAGFRLAKLNVSGAVMAALREGSPRTLDEIESRLGELGFPLTSGQQTLRRAIVKTPHIRYRVDGALELVSGPELDRAFRWMGYKTEEGAAQPTPPPTPSPPTVTGAITLAELESAKSYGLFPPTFSFRRKLTVVLDALRGEATLEETLRALGLLSGQAMEHLGPDALRTLKGCQAVVLRSDRLELNAGSPETEATRGKYREWSGKYGQRELEKVARQESFERAGESYRERKVAERERCQQLSVAVLAGYWASEQFAMVVLPVRGAKPVFLRDPAETLEPLSRYNVLIGLDPRTSLERMGWEMGETMMLDLRPPFKSSPMRGGRRKPVSVSEGVAMVTDAKLTEPEELGAWLANGQEGKARFALESDAETLRRYWRFGVTHGAVLRHDEWVPVAWNVNQDITLHDAMSWCVEDRQPLALTLREGRSGLFWPERVEWRSRYGEDNLTEGEWEDGTAQAIEFSEIADCTYPHIVSPQRRARVLW